MEKEEKKTGIITDSLEAVLHNCMLPYAEYVILDRALPRVEDGLKPVQRRILYSMYDQGMLPDKDYKKSARVVGDCLAKYHPHGDTSVYDAMVRLAQPFNMRETLVSGHGNFGSVDGDSAAAMRYTEVKLQPLALELLRDIDKDTVNWDLNFDDSLKEPATLPGRFPNLLVNGASGIAVGLATNIPPHNLSEVIDGACAVIDNPKITVEELMQIIKGPDFPTGGTVVAGDELKKAYETGKGKIKIYSKMTVEKLEHEKRGSEADRAIVVTELPYQTNKAALLKKIYEMAEANKDGLGGITEVCDESDRKGMRAVIKIRKGADADKIIASLNKNSGLMASFGINMVAIADGKPQQMGLKQVLSYYVEYQRNVVLRRTKFELERAEERAHILEGLIIAVTNIDEVIRIIKNSPDTPTARTNLQEAFVLSEKQAQAILDLRLARLTKLEVVSLQNELAELKERIIYLRKVVDSKRMQFTIVKNEMREIKKKYGNERRTVVLGSDNDVVVEKASEESADRPLESFFVGVSAEGLIRKIKSEDYKKILALKKPEKRDLFATGCVATSRQTVFAFTNFGNCFKIDLELIPDSKGKQLDGVKFDQIYKKAGSEKPVALFAVDDDTDGKLMFFTRDGSVKLSPWSDYFAPKSPFAALKLKDGDEVVSVENYRENSQMFFATKKGICLYADGTVPEQGRVAGGVKGIELAAGDEVVYGAQVDDDFNGEIFVATSFGTFKRVILGTINKLSRARKGVKLVELGDASLGECVVFVKWLAGGESFDFAIFDRLGTVYYSDSTKVAVENRTTKGKQLSGLGVCQPERLFPVARQR